MFCPSCGEFISAEDPTTCPFCGVDVKHFASQASGFQSGEVSELDFKRPTGLTEVSRRRYIDRRLPRCPFCRSAAPDWEYAEVRGWLNRANFRCQRCLGILSVPVGAWNSPTSLLGLTGPSEYLRVEKVGNSPGMGAVAQNLVGGEFALEKLRTWAERPGEEITGLAG